MIQNPPFLPPGMCCIFTWFAFFYIALLAVLPMCMSYLLAGYLVRNLRKEEREKYTGPQKKCLGDQELIPMPMELSPVLQM